MATVNELKALCDVILPYLTKPPNLASSQERHAYLSASLEFAYTAVELVEAQLERNLRDAQLGVENAHTEQEILEMERRLIEEQTKMDNMKAACRADTARVMLIATSYTKSPAPCSLKPDGEFQNPRNDQKSTPRGKVVSRLSKIWPSTPL